MDNFDLTQINFISFWNKKADLSNIEKLRAEQVEFVQERKDFWIQEIENLPHAETTFKFALSEYRQNTFQTKDKAVLRAAEMMANFEFGVSITLRDAGFSTDLIKTLIIIDVYSDDFVASYTPIKNSVQKRFIPGKIYAMLHYLLFKNLETYQSGSTLPMSMQDFWILVGVEEATHYISDHTPLQNDHISFAHLTPEQFKELKSRYLGRHTFRSIDTNNKYSDKIRAMERREDMPLELGETVHIRHGDKYEFEGLLAKKYFADSLGIPNDLDEEIKMVIEIQKMSKETLLEWE